MSGSHHWSDERVPSPERDDPRRAHDRESLIGMSEVGRSARGEERGVVVPGTAETQPVGAVLPRYRTSDTTAPDTGASPVIDASTTSFGSRVEKILFFAEQEAAETRRNATRESTALIERARAETEALRQEAEQAVLAYRDEVDRLAEQRSAELDERERRIEWQRESARADRTRQLAEAHREADRIVSEALGHADAVRAEVDQELDERRAEVERQMAWLEESRRAARDLAHMLLRQAGEDGEVPPPGSGRPGSDRDAGSGGSAGSAAPVGHDAPVERRGEPTASAAASIAPSPSDVVDVRDVADDGATGVASSAADVAYAGASRRHSPCVALPPELRFAGSIGGVPVLDDEPEEVLEAPRPRQRTTGRADRDWFGYGDTTERLHAVPSGQPDATADRSGSGRTA